MNWKFENVVKGPVTSIVGVLLIVCSVYVYLSKDNSDAFAILLLAAGLGAFGLKDPRIPGSGAMVFIAVALLFNSCITYQKCIDTFGTLATDTVRVSYRDTVRITHVLPRDSVTTDINIDTLCHYWRTMAGDLTGQAAGQRVELEWYVDAYERVLRLKAKTVRDTLYLTKIVEGTVNCPPQVVVDPDKDAPWHSRLWKNFQFFAAWVLLVGLLFFLVYLKIK